MGKRATIAPSEHPKIPARFALIPAATRLPLELLTGLSSSNRAGAAFARFRQRSVKHAGVARCLDALRQNPRLKLLELTTVSGLSRRGLNKAFRTHLGYPPGVVIIVLRLRAALNLLLKSRLSIPTIAVRCGYRNSNSLYVALRRYFRITPLGFRRNIFPSTLLHTTDLPSSP